MIFGLAVIVAHPPPRHHSYQSRDAPSPWFLAFRFQLEEAAADVVMVLGFRPS